jgi:uncharacterized protein YbaP (TraB family)
MVRFAQTVTVVLMSAVAAFAGGDGGQGRIADADDGSAPSFLWRAVGPHGAEVFLLGSIHALPEDAYPLSEAIEKAYAASSVCAFEVDLVDLDRVGSSLLAAGALAEGERLDDVLSPPTRELLAEHLAAGGLSESAFTAMNPWMVGLTLTSLELVKAGYSPESGLDLYMARRAARDGKRIEAFETADFQVGLFAGMSREESESFLRYTLRDLETVVPQLEAITRAWKEGDTAAISGLLAEAFDEEPELFSRLVTERNARWLPKVEALLAGSETALVVVGALHLVGPSGLVEQLRAAGYVVAQY